MLKPEQTLQLQLEVSETLTQHTTRDGIGLALAEVMNKVVPFDFFLHSIWRQGDTTGYRISSAKTPDGKFVTYHDEVLEKFKAENFAEFSRAGQFLSNPDNAGIYQGETLQKLSKDYAVFDIGFKMGIRSIMVFNMMHENGLRHSMVVSSAQESVFGQSQFDTIRTAFPQIKMAFENLFKYEKLKQEEEKRKVQLELNNVLLEHTNREDFATALASIINRSVPCERFVLRIWYGPIQVGYRIPLKRQPDDSFVRFPDDEVVDFATRNPAAMVEYAEYVTANSGVIQGEEFAKLRERMPLANVIGRAFESNSLMALPFKSGDATCLLTLYNRAAVSFDSEQYELMKILLPQIILAFENLLKYEKLSVEEKNKQVQLELNNVLFEHTNREDFALALARIINKSVPCERFILRVWNGPIQVGYRIPLKRNDDGSFSRFSDRAVVELASQNPQEMLRSSMFISRHEGIIQGNDFKKVQEEFPIALSVSREFGIHSLMVLPFKTGDTTCILILGNSASVSFTHTQYQLIKVLLPQIMLAFENLVKYEKLKEEERERKTQLDLMSGFNTEGDIEEMARLLIGKLTEFIPFEYWSQISSLQIGNDLNFRLAFRVDGKFTDIAGAEYFEKIKHPPIDARAFRSEHAFLFEKLAIYVGEDFDALINRVSFFKALHDTLNLNSLAVFPISMQGSVNTVNMMGSVRQYAFSQADLESMSRILPYVSMAANQYHSLYHIQKLTQQLQMEKNYLVEEIKSNYNFDEIIGTSHLMKDVFKKISQVANTDSTVLILGETGTGKELISRAIHNQSSRKDKVLIKVNCASLPAQLIESELFGHEKGSFTGALEKRIGKFELANGGTIFLDEMGELPLELQAKLLRVLQEREIERIGGKSTIQLDVRIIAATNRDLETEVAEGRFRSDLFYRLNVFPIHLPSLRERREDIPMLIAHFLQKFSKKMKRPLRGIKDDILQDLLNYDWPGNIRELENIMEQAVIVGDTNSIKLRKPVQRKATAIPKEVMPDETASMESQVFEILSQTKGKVAGPDGAAMRLNMRPAQIEEYERKWILAALQKCDGRIRGENGAAELIGMKPTTLEARMKKLAIGKKEIFST